VKLSSSLLFPIKEQKYPQSILIDASTPFYLEINAILDFSESESNTIKPKVND
jgi:hypothetical protein